MVIDQDTKRMAGGPDAPRSPGEIVGAAVGQLKGRLGRMEKALLETNKILKAAIDGAAILAARVDELERVPEPPRGAMDENHTRATSD